MFSGCVDRNIEALIRIEHAALARLNELLANPEAVRSTAQTNNGTSPNAELFVELNQEKRLTLELQEQLSANEKKLASSIHQLEILQNDISNLRENLQEREQEIARLNDAVKKLRQDRTQSPALVATRSDAVTADPVVAILRSRIKFLEEENLKLKNSLVK